MQYFCKKKNKGFTLIELLVVIAIIGILSTIVIVNVNSARAKAKDTAIKGSLDSLRSAAELYYDTVSSYASTCTMADCVRIEAAVVAQGGEMTCNDESTVWAAASSLSDDQYYCVDSVGNAKVTGDALNTNTVCP